MAEPQGQRRPPASTSCRPRVDEYLDYLAHLRNVSAHTQRAYRADIETFLDWCDRKDVDPLALSTAELRAWMGELRRARYAPRTLNRKLSALRGFYAWMNERDISASQALATMPGPKMGRHLPKVIGDKEVRQLLDAAGRQEAPWGVFDTALIELLYASGARIQEVSNLNLESVDLERGQARLFGKGSKERLVPLYPKAVRAIERYLAEVRPERAAHTPAKLEDAEDAAHALFLSQRGRRMSAAALRARFEKAVRLAGLPPTVTPHTMRHTYATELLNGDANLRSVQELLGHASLSTTQIYTNLSMERLGSVLSRSHPRGD